MITLENELVRLRALEPEDLDYLYIWENDTSAWQVSNTITPFSRYVLKQYLEHSHLDIYETKQLRLMIELNNEKAEETKVIGCIDLFNFDPYNLRAGVGILIANQSDRQKGYANEALKVLIHYAFTTLNLHQLYCNITTDNEASIKLFANNGFKINGTKSDWIKCAGGWKAEYFLQLKNQLF